MNQPSPPNLLESIRDQFNFGPYPRHPLGETSEDNFNSLYRHCMANPYYMRHQKVFDPQAAVILDAGCGSGYEALTLSYANPGAKIVGIDISDRSVELARQRFAHHGLENAEFHVMGIEDVAQLGMQFDYINCDEVLYLFPQPAVGLSVLKQVLKPHGMIRANLHSLFQRNDFFRAQEMFRMMGLMDGNPEEFEIRMSVDILAALKDKTRLRQTLSKYANYADQDTAAIQEDVLMNLLFQGDRGFTIAELFDALRGSDLEMISMVDWATWDVLDLFKEPDDLPALLAMSLPVASLEEKLRMYELISPVHRLLDFWCGHPDQGSVTVPVSDWTAADWENATVQIQPILRHKYTQGGLTKAAQRNESCFFSEHFNATMAPERILILESVMSSILLPLLDGPQAFFALVDRYLTVRPVDPVTLAPLDRQIAVSYLSGMLETLESNAFVMLERS
jgi:SAM-dependent methyltransferase